MGVHSGPVCNRDCFNCPHEDCILDELTHADYQAEAELERELLFPKTARQKKVAAQKRAYYEANREKVAAQQRAYREANREVCNAYMREYMRRRRQEAKRKEASV